MGFLGSDARAALDALVALERDAAEVGAAGDGAASDGAADASAGASPLARLRGIRSLVVALDADPAALAAVRAALASGATWDEVADAAGLSPSAAKQRWAGDDDEIAARREASRRRKRDRPSSKPTDLPGLSVAEAAARFGVTPQAIYQRVTRGLLEARTIELPDGRSYKRVFPADTAEG